MSATAEGALPAIALSDKQLGELLGLIRGADTVELKLTVGHGEQRSAMAALGIDPIEAQIRQVYFFDTPDLTLYHQGVVVRARRVQGKGDDTVVKLRPVVPDQLSRKLREAEGFGVEVDAMPGGFVCSASMKGVPPDGAVVRPTILEDRPIRKLFTKSQRALFKKYAPEGLELDELSVLGPIFVLKVKFAAPEYGRKLVAEVWLYPDESRILELSTKCLPKEAFEVVAETRAYLAEKGVDTTAEQETKTRRALDYFSQKLKAQAAG